MGNKLPEILIVRDTREKENHGWWFDEEEKRPGKVRIVGTKEDTLEAGDYRLSEAPDLCVCERKNGFRELFGNFSPVENKERFHREMEKLRNVKHKYLIIEGNLSQDVLSLSVPQFTKGSAPPCSRVLEWVIELQQEYGIVPIFAGDAGQKTAKMIFKSIARKYL